MAPDIHFNGASQKCIVLSFPEAAAWQLKPGIELKFQVQDTVILAHVIFN